MRLPAIEVDSPSVIDHQAEPCILRLFTDVSRITHQMPVLVDGRDPQSSGFHPFARLAVELVPQEGQYALYGPPDKCFLYSDGSYKDGLSAWALAVVAFRRSFSSEPGGGFSFVGFIAGSIDIYEDGPLTLEREDTLLGLLS
jgi:hypothetical protein